MKKKILAILLVLCMTVGALASCGECKHEKYTAGVCDSCGAKCEHKEYSADGTCKTCGIVCTHTTHAKDGNCTACGKAVAHTYGTDGKCTVCEKSCVHSYGQDGLCTVCGKECNHNFVDEVCTVCGNACVEHNFVDGECTACGRQCIHEYEDSVCEICGLECTEHDFEQGICTECGSKCGHSELTGVCAVCGDDCEHTWADSVCTKCSDECEHPYYKDSKCVACEKACAHERFTNGRCDLCRIECSHPSYVGGACTECGMACRHTYSNGACTKCGMACGHTSYEDGRCENCGKACTHPIYSGGECQVCGTKITPPDRTTTYKWTTPQTFVFQMNLATSSQELGDSSQRYMAGVTDEATAVDKSVIARNAAAINTTKVTPQYRYIADGSTEYGWGKYCHKMTTIVGTHVVDESPDAFCGFIWDMTFTANLGNLTNLYTHSRGEGAWDGENYFSFTKDDYNIEMTGDEGYNMGLMRATSPVPDTHLYVYASNYNVDVLRAMYCIPVSLELVSSIDIEKSTGDRDNDGDFDVDDFFKMILGGQFTYENMAILAGAVYDNTSGSTTATLNDTLGFAMSVTMGLSQAGFAYSQPFQYITDGGTDANGLPVYLVDSENSELFAMYESAETLFTSSGIGRFTQNQEKSQVGVSGAGMGIRTRFSQDKILFGGVICVGALDYDAYQNMDNGFGIAPLPTYISTGNDSSVYVTAVHNLARVVTISKASTKFVQCSAYFDYQARNSTTVMNQYYRTLQYNTVGGRAYNIEVLNALRNNITENNRDQYLSIVVMYDYSSAYTSVATRTQVLNNKWPDMYKDATFSAADAKEKHKEIFAPAIEIALKAYAQKISSYER